MKKLLLVLMLTAIVAFGYCQSQLIGTASASFFCSKKNSDTAWGEWSNTNTSFAFYKNGEIMKKIIITTPVSIITLICYGEDKQKYTNGDYRYVIYCYAEGDSSAKTYNYKEFFRITDYNNVNKPYSIITLVNKDPYDYSWELDSFTKQ